MTSRRAALNSVILRIVSVFVLIATAAICPDAMANVSLKNGNFFIGYTDIIYPGGFEPKIERVYNSKTPYKGIFGWGWGNEYEVHLKVSADGSVVVYEYGGGAENRFNPVAFKKKELEKAVDMIASAAKATGAAGTAAQIAAYRSKLLKDATFRNDEWEKFLAQGKVKARQIPVGAQLVSNRFSYQYITKVKGGYVRSFDNGRVEQFGDSGKLLKISDKNNNFIQLSYGKDGKLQKIVDNFNRKIFFTFNARGLVEKIQGENGKTATYKYNSKDELVATKDVDGNSYTYAYTTNGRHNLAQVGYSDKTVMKVAYYGRDKFENVKSVTDRDGTLTEYSYDISSKNRNNIKVGVHVKTKEGKSLSKSTYEYVLKVKPTGEEWTYKMVATIDGDRTETIYNECCGLPLLIKRGKHETSFEYDAKGHVTKKTTPTEVTKLKYHAKFGKVTQVQKFSKINKKKKPVWSQFKYDKKGNLTFAKNSGGKGVKLFYDTHGRIKSMIDQDRRRIDFQYNENSKPVKITDPKLGSIKVNYANSGEIKNIESPAGRKIAMQVTSAFQNLLDIIRPAGVSLSF